MGNTEQIPGNGSGSGVGVGNISGRSSISVCGSGFGSGSGYGSAYCYGSGLGLGVYEGSGYGYTDGSGLGLGSGEGSGYGYTDGSGLGLGSGDGSGVAEDIDVLGVVKGGDAEAPVVNESLTTEPPTGPAQPDPAQNQRAMPAHASTIFAVTDAATAFSEKYPGGDFAMFRVFCDGMAYAEITKS